MPVITLVSFKDVLKYRLETLLIEKIKKLVKLSCIPNDKRNMLKPCISSVGLSNRIKAIERQINVGNCNIFLEV